MEKEKHLKKAIYYYNKQRKELVKNGDTMKRRHLIYKMIEQVKEYKKNNGEKIPKRITLLYDEYYEELIFTPCVEDFEDMKEWLY